MPQLQLILRELEDLNIPRFLFLNKIDKAETKVMEALQILQPASRKPLVMRQLPIRQQRVGQLVLATRRRESRQQQGCALLHAGEACRP